MERQKCRKRPTNKLFHDLKLDTDSNKRQKLGQVTNCSDTHGQNTKDVDIRMRSEQQRF